MCLVACRKHMSNKNYKNIYAYIHVYIHTCIHTYICAYARVCITNTCSVAMLVQTDILTMTILMTTI